MRNSKSRLLVTALPVLIAGLFTLPAHAQKGEPAGQTFDDVVDRAIQQEARLMDTMRAEQPIVETYIEELTKDGDYGAVPDRDFYFLGKLDLHQGVEVASFVPTSVSTFKKPFHLITSHLFQWNEFFPRGFASRIFIDQDFDRRNYRFEFVRREFLGDVRCIVMDVRPLKDNGKNWVPKVGAKKRFKGRIWVEDRDFNVVRFNGTYGEMYQGYLHFDSWRVNAGPNLWLPAAIYTEENDYTMGPRKKTVLRAQTRLWDYEAHRDQAQATFTSMDVEAAHGVKDDSDAAAETSPVEAQRMWQRQSEDNVIERLQTAGLISPAGDVDNILTTVLNNLEITNHIELDPQVRVRVMPTTPLESLSIGHTIVLSRGLIDVLPDEACLAAVLAHELAHIVLGQTNNTKFAFADRLLFDDTKTLDNVSLARNIREERLADERAMDILKKSPYKDKLARVGLFVRMLSQREAALPHLIRPLLGNGVADGHQHLRLASLMEVSPELQMSDTEQIAALPLGSRVQMDPWSNELHFTKTRNVPLMTAGEKMPFELTPIMLHLRREEKADSVPPPPVKTEHAIAATEKP